MATKISHSDLFKRSFLIVKRDRVKFYESGMFFGARSFRFREISSVLLGADDRLTFQVGLETFSLPVNPGKPKHQAAIAELVAGLEGSRASANSAAHLPS